ncbi:ABC transport permease subunit MlaE [Poriferisphaera corsica]|uniref:ABC transport permease subunit MlaE n=1 Tax=Poriferisphaera corsica TaxID=2528020 RepID=A0A517YTQ0_9BACT|nr:ABC transporter permease [Poriferisphaera corsica]QDU33601.1 ABC transport permease subunit MlaE [Poriferisphaera corsica]
MYSLVINRVGEVGRKVQEQLELLGLFTRFCVSTAIWMIWGGQAFGRFRLLIPQLYYIGTKSMWVVMLVGAFVGMVFGVEAYDQFAAIGQEARLGGIISISVLKQIGPVLAAVMIAGRVGGAISAELGTMKVTEQIDALRVMGTDPIAYLVVPRVIACLIMVPVLTVFSDLLGVLGGWFVIVRGYGVDNGEYWAFSKSFVGPWDIFTGLGKGFFFGGAIGMISCYKGFNCGAGASGVGRAATDAFVTSFIAIIISNFFLATFFKNIYSLIWGSGGPTAFG